MTEIVPSKSTRAGWVLLFIILALLAYGIYRNNVDPVGLDSMPRGPGPDVSVDCSDPSVHCSNTR